MGNEGSDVDEFEKALELALDFSNLDYEEEEEEDEDGVEGEDENEEDEDDKNENQNENALESTQLQSLAYEALAERKRKALSLSHTLSDTEMLRKKARQDDISDACMEEVLEAMTYGFRRRSRKAKKRGRRKGSKNKHNPEITRMLGDATLHYVHGNYEEAVSVLNEVVRMAPHVPESYHTLGLAHNALGNTEKAMAFYTIAARLMPKDSSLWKLLFTWHIERGDVARARMCLSKAIRADPDDVDLRSLHASLYDELGDFQKAAESYEQIARIYPENIQALKTAIELYLKCGQIDRSVNILEDYLKLHSSEADFSVINLLPSVLMRNNAHETALQHIERLQLVYYSGKEMPVQLKIKAGICHMYLGNIEKAEVFFGVLQLQCEKGSIDPELIVEVGDAFMTCEHFHSALNYYHMAESKAGFDNGYLHLKIAHCYLSLNERAKAVSFYYKALHVLKDSVSARLALASLLFEDAKEDEAILLLSPPEDSGATHLSPEQTQWWLDSRIKMKLCQIYRAKGKLEEFVNTMLPLIRESLFAKSLKQKVKKRLTTRVLRKRTKILDVQGSADVFGEVRPLASRSDLLKACRARKLLQRKEEQKAAERAAGIDWHSDNTDAESPQEEYREPPLPNFLKDHEHHDLIIDLCKALQSLQRHWEALEIINLSLKLGKLTTEKKEELQSLAAQISYSTTDPKHGFDCVRSIVLQRPYSLAAWNCYYNITSRLGRGYSKHGKFLRYMRGKHADCVAPIIISGHQFTMLSQHQDAARDYLEAYKLLPDSPLINLCVGTALINLALGFRLQNKHQCLAQGLTFLYNNLHLAENNQEALYNIGRGYHHVGLVTLAASYYEKVMRTPQKDYPIPKLLNENSETQENVEPGYCDLRREAAYNLHLIYKRSGALDLARQVLKDYSTF